jgi:hypothetical protein
MRSHGSAGELERRRVRVVELMEEGMRLLPKGATWHGCPIP